MAEIEPQPEPPMQVEETKILKETQPEDKPKKSSLSGIFDSLSDIWPYIVAVIVAIIMYYFKQEPEQMLSMDSFDTP